MATIAKTIPLLILATLLLSLQTQGRESRFFSKVTRGGDDDINDVKLKAKEEVDVEQPTFLPQSLTNNAGYGLYKQKPTFDNNNFKSTNDVVPEYYDNSGHSENYAPQLRGPRKTPATGFVAEKQGMSDTRFLENGRYFYDLQNEKPTYYNDVQSYNNYNNVNDKASFYDLQNDKSSANDVQTYNYGAYQESGNDRSPAEYYNNNGVYTGTTNYSGNDEDDFESNP